MAGKGSIEKRDTDGFTWRLTISAGYDKEGKKIRHTKTVKVEGKTEAARRKAAEKELSLFLAETEKGTYLEPSKLTFEDFINKWLVDYAQVNLEPKTLHRYKEILDKRVIPALGHIKLEKIQPTQLIAFYNNLRENGIRLDNKEGGLSERTILHHHRLISSILTCAVQWQLILNNPCERIKPPKAEKKEAKHYDEEYTLYMLDLLDKYEVPLKYKVMIHVTVYGGLRQGELVGLEWSDIEFDNELIRIRQAGQYLTGKGVFTKRPKNESSVRVISLPESVMDVLKQYKVFQNEQRLKAGSLWVDSNRLFTQWDGKPIFPDTPSKWFHKFINKHNETIKQDGSIPDEDKKKYLLPDLNFHGLRHTNATLLIGEGVDIQTVSSRLGHARTSTTTDIYSHSLKHKDKEAADKLQNLFSKQKSNKIRQA